MSLDAGRVGTCRVVAVVLLLSLAGCSGLGVDGEPDRPTFEVPPTAADPGVGADTDPDPDPYPYGVNESGVTTSFGLLQSHVGLLRLESFRVVRERTVTDRNLTLVRSTRVDARVGVDRLRYRIDIDRGSPDTGRQSVYAPLNTTADGTRVQGPVVAVALADGEVQSATRVRPLYDDPVSPRQVLSGPPSYRDQLYRYLTTVEAARVERLDGENGTGGVRVTATETTGENRVTSGAGTVSDLSVAMTVDADGVITETVASYALTRNGTTVQVTERIAYTEIGTVSVAPPEWYEGVEGRVTGSLTPGPGLLDLRNGTATD